MIDTCRKVEFGIWAMLSALWLLDFVVGCIAGEPEFERLALAACGAVVCQLYWELWNEKAPVLHIEIFKLHDGREIRKEHWE